MNFKPVKSRRTTKSNHNYENTSHTYENVDNKGHHYYQKGYKAYFEDEAAKRPVVLRHRNSNESSPRNHVKKYKSLSQKSATLKDDFTSDDSEIDALRPRSLNVSRDSDNGMHLVSVEFNFSF